VQKRKKEKVRVTQDSRAKLNLFLDVLHKRDDGFHEVETIIAPISLADQLIFRLTYKSEVKIYCTSDTLQESENIIYKIACFLKDTYNVKNGVEIKLKKNIPLSAGLGGGSSNAANTIQVLNSLWNLKLTLADLHRIVSLFGSDINFFLDNKTALLGGRGEIIKDTFPDPLIEHILLVNPGIEIASRNAYSWSVLNKPHEEIRSSMAIALNNDDIDAICKNLYNGLEQGVFAHYPILQDIKVQLIELGAIGSLMSGSGSTVFGIFSSREKLIIAKKYFKKYNYWLFETKIEQLVN